MLSPTQMDPSKINNNAVSFRKGLDKSQIISIFISDFFSLQNWIDKELDPNKPLWLGSLGYAKIYVIDQMNNCYC